MLGRCCRQLRPVFNPGAFKGGAELPVGFYGDRKGLGGLTQQQKPSAEGQVPAGLGAVAPPTRGGNNPCPRNLRGYGISARGVPRAGLGSGVACPR